MSNPTGFTSEQEKDLRTLQQIAEQIQAIGSQIQQYEIQVTEIKSALDELNSKQDDEVVYKSVGGLLIKKDAKSVRDELTERKEFLELRLKTLKDQYKSLDEQGKSLQNKLTAQFQNR